MGFLLSILGGIISILDKLIPDRKSSEVRRIVEDASQNRDAVSFWIRNGGMRNGPPPSGDQR